MIHPPIASESDALVLAINRRSLFAHVGPAPEVVIHLDPKDSHGAGLEFYSIEATPMTFQQVRSMAESGVRPPIQDGSETRQAELVGLLQDGLDLLRRYLAEHPEAGKQPGGTDPITHVPVVDGDYAKVLEQLAVLFSPLAWGDWGGPLHLLWHMASGTPI